MNFSEKNLLKPTGDQPQAIENLVAGLRAKRRFQTLVGVTGSGKTLTMAHVISRAQRPALVISHNKTLAAQLYQEFKEFFPENAAHYFVSYYDYYQPEAYLPATDTYIEKDAKINEFIDRLRHAATQSALSRRDFIIVASVSCIYGIGDPEEYEKMSLDLKVGAKIKRQKFLEHLTDLQYERNDYEKKSGSYSVKGEVIEIISPDGETATRVEFFGDKIEKTSGTKIFPAKHFVTPKKKLELAMRNIKTELEARLKELKKEGKLLEAQRLEQKTRFDLEMLKTVGYVSGIENYSRQLSFRKPGSPPATLLDYLPKDTIIFIDESHMSVPQIRGMYFGDQSRKQTLVDYGFRLPSALDNRPLKFEEFLKKVKEAIFVSATPAEFELSRSKGAIAEQLVRPTGLLDPWIEVRPAKEQIKDAEAEILKAVKAKERVLLLTLTKRLAEEVSDWLKERGIRAEYLHSEIKTLARTDILRKLREGEFDVLVGINLLREGLDLPEVALVLILDADKEGYLRNYTSLVQTIGRAARHARGRAILYADTITKSIEKTVMETKRRREFQEKFNKEHGITPKPIKKEIRPSIFSAKGGPASGGEEFAKAMERLSKKSRLAAKAELEKMMLEAASQLEFEKAAKYRDILKTLA
ncbi:excinuclease ABC subunit B [Candidatus Giovannonibacteria bacterium RIFCSPHIGHO2_01_FULL_48_47]|nr:MAG: excinuclease ABC subunit B [Candidatus Giovannonibacteria bacterium RIFCSPHIGHO2_01_FULL_48_47]OGF68710.1 MAG: excinuclease ABC subunit B [Candidatus Giovannonibacteria bacterium RIFCSPHIGHO2_02_FULL_48_15]OGF89626.1 MAG: excinuclease ABC subunit B [Candidatus Giovannonibacteria bacterium RIFCSPLOWO2_01_FULL_48_47]OGF95131.1 MAG: excinuclease ABC subunit B [Candidatus Giovannonibacteria bacterium RIFOXYC1_FULL_48_8]OGF96357.1 MAG: excinuclease ABC subunit B [Candidatus Giovannonibacteri